MMFYYNVASISLQLTSYHLKIKVSVHHLFTHYHKQQIILKLCILLSILDNNKGGGLRLLVIPSEINPTIVNVQNSNS